MLKNVLLVLHVLGGTAALLAAGAAVTTQILRTRHIYHVVAGRTFVVAMITACVMSLPLAYLIDSVFLALIGIFSGYLTVVGLRLAKNRRGVVGPVDHAIHGVMAAASLVMIVLGARTLAGNGLVLGVFGLIGLGLSVLNVVRLRRGPIRGRARIADHLLMTLSASVAALTAFLVVNGPFGIADWFLPTVLIIPVAIGWSRRVRAGRPTTLDGPRTRMPLTTD